MKVIGEETKKSMLFMFHPKKNDSIKCCQARFTLSQGGDTEV